MREIKFRGKRIDNSEWVYGYYVKDPAGKHRIYCVPFETATSNTYYFVYAESVCQFTGLLDCNGDEIYENDLLKVKDTYNNCWSIDSERVLFSTGYVGGWVISNGKHNLNLGSRQNCLKVIGNVLDNPELLERSPKADV